MIFGPEMKPKIKKNANLILTRRDVLKAGLHSALAASITGNIFISGCRKSPRLSDLPHIFLVTVDTLRRDFLGCYGYSRGTSPNIDDFSAEAAIYDTCYAHAPETISSFASIHTGFYPHESKLVNQPLPSEAQTIAETLRESGYNTLAVVSNYVLQSPEGFEQGFMVYDDTLLQAEAVRKQPERVAKDTTERAIELLTQYHNAPVFMWIHYQDPHGPYTPPPPYSTMFSYPDHEPRLLKVNPSVYGKGGIPSYQKLGDNTDFYHYVSQYEGEIRYQDASFGQLLAAIKELGIYDKSVIMFSSDHGECLGEKDYYFCHSENLYEPLIQVPLIIKYPDEKPQRIANTAQHIDLFPTILKLIGRSPENNLRGRDLRCLTDEKMEIFSEKVVNRKTSLVCENMKLIFSHSPSNWEFYDLTADPTEKDNLISKPEHSQRITDMKKRIHGFAYYDVPPEIKPVERRKRTEQELENLKSLGYLE